MRVSSVFHSMGCPWEITYEFHGDQKAQDSLNQAIGALLHDFDETYSRFKPQSFIRQIADQTGSMEVPEDLVKMLRLLEKVNKLSDGLINPFIGHTLENLGYDDSYSFEVKSTRQAVPSMDEALTIIDDTCISLQCPALIDLGGVGKGYAVDLICKLLSDEGVSECVINGSGDILQRGSGAISVGLENPINETQVIGKVLLVNQALASSAINRRKWQQYHHIVNPDTVESPSDIAASWVLAKNAAEADILATALFLVSPEKLESEFTFEWLVMDNQKRTYRSKNFHAELF